MPRNTTTSPSGRGINPLTGSIGDMPGGMDYLAGIGPAPPGVNIPDLPPVIHAGALGASQPGPNSPLYGQQSPWARYAQLLNAPGNMMSGGGNPAVPNLNAIRPPRVMSHGAPNLATDATQATAQTAPAAPVPLSASTATSLNANTAASPAASTVTGALAPGGRLIPGQTYDPTGGYTGSNIVQGVPANTHGFGAYGDIPQLPDPTHTATAAILGDIGNLGSLYGLGNALTAQGANQARQQYDMNLPGYEGMTSQASANIAEDLAGQVPQDVINLLQQQGAERGVATGSPGSANANSAYLRALGLTSLGRRDLGQQELGAAIGRTPVGPQFNPMNFMVSPGDEQQAAAMQAIYNAAPNPTLAAQEALRLAQLGLGGGGVGGAPGLTRPTGSQGQPTGPGAQPVVSAGGGVVGQQQPPQGVVNRTNPNTGQQVIIDRQGNVTQGPVGTTAGSNWALFNDPNWNSYFDSLLSGGGDQTDTFDWQSLFGQPSVQDTGTLGMGLDPSLNAVLGTPQNQNWWETNPQSDWMFPGETQPAPSGSYYDFTTGGQTSYQNPQAQSWADLENLYWGEEGP